MWSVTLGDRIESSACFCEAEDKEFVAVGCYDHNLYILDARNGKVTYVEYIL